MDVELGVALFKGKFIAFFIFFKESMNYNKK
jgi:hypothetical protein